VKLRLAIVGFGKLNNIAPRRIASQLAAHIETAVSVQCALVSRIGQSVADPQIVDIQTTTSDDQPVAADDSITEKVRDNLAQLPQLYEEILRGEVPLY
jgi:S-adenosylmethionine synthetase